jgi:hypothetical protein
MSLENGPLTSVRLLALRLLDASAVDLSKLVEQLSKNKVAEIKYHPLLLALYNASLVPTAADFFVACGKLAWQMVVLALCSSVGMLLCRFLLKCQHMQIVTCLLLATLLILYGGS